MITNKLKPASDSLIDLSLNECYNTSLKLDVSLSKQLARFPFNIYPNDKLYKSLEKSASELYRVPINKVLACNGSDDGIFLLMQRFALSNRKKPILLLSPTFSMYNHYAKVLQLDILACDLTEDFDFPFSEIDKKIKKYKPSMLFLPSPLAPTGKGILPKYIRYLLDNFKDIIFVIDEAYIEFSTFKSNVNRIGNYPNVVVLRTLSKFYGLASLRVGFVISNYRAELRAIQAPFSIGAVNAFLATEALKIIKEEDTSVIKEEIAHNKNKLIIALTKSGIVEYMSESDTNFIFFSSKKSSQFVALLKENGFLVKDLSSSFPNAVRMSIPSSANTIKIIKLIEQL